MSDEDYCYPPDFKVLRNRFDLRNADELDYFEREFVTNRAAQPFPVGDFDLTHLRAIHHHLFQDVYDWAGELRTVEISKGGSQFQFRHYIETGMADVHRRIRAHNYLRDLDVSSFADLAGEIMGDVNYVHPFREGNGRAQLYYFKQLAEQAGFDVMLSRMPNDTWMDASRKAHMGDYAPMSACLRRMLFERPHPPQGRSRSRKR